MNISIDPKSDQEVIELLREVGAERVCNILNTDIRLDAVKLALNDRIRFGG